MAYQNITRCIKLQEHHESLLFPVLASYYLCFDEFFSAVLKFNRQVWIFNLLSANLKIFVDFLLLVLHYTIHLTRKIYIKQIHDYILWIFDSIERNTNNNKKTEKF